MNKNRFRLIYNQARAMWMAVPEIVKSHIRKSSTGKAAARGCVKSILQQSHTLRPITFNLMLALGMAVIIPNSLNMTTAQADIIADQSVSSTLRPMVMNAANGTPLVNIQTPSAAGVSRNVYSQFDVNSGGAILNNSRTNVETQLGGWVQANPYLAGGAAKVILNEVNSLNPSLLNGYIEVAGSRAQVVIANPAGISCNGCGFINAHRATLTTGTPILNNGSLLGYRVGGGNIQVSGNGLDTSQANFTDVIARAVEVNAGIWANALNVTAGSNLVNLDQDGNQTSVTPIGPDVGSVAPAFAVDVAALGGMYAGKITMVGTESGMGVRNAGTLGASAGEVSITADGLLQNTGSLSAKTNIQLDTVALAGNGSIKADADISIQLDTDYTHIGELQAGRNLNLATSGDINNQSTILASQALNINAQNLSNTGAGEIVGTDVEINTTGTFTNRGLVDGVNTYVSASALDNLQSGSLFGDYLSINVANLSNTLGATIAARTQLDIGATTIENLSNGLMFSAGDLVIGGSLDSNNQAIGVANSLINDGSTIEALGNASFTVTDMQNLNANLVTQVVQTGTGSFDRFTPRGQSVILESADYPGAHIGNVNVEWRSAGPYTFREYTRYLGTKKTYETQVVSSTPGQILAGGDMTLLGNITNSDSQIIAGGNLDVSGATVQNLNSTGQTITSYSGTAYYYDWDGNDDDYDVDVIGAYNPANTVLTYNLSTSRLEGSTTPTGSGTTVTSAAIPVVTNSLFQPSPDVAASYLIESNARFTNYRNWLSSDYMLSQLASDPATMQKRLGDGFYEQKLIREQINQLTGRRFLTGYSNDETQYQALMDNAITTASTLQLIPGVALTPAQTAQLTSDIMWLVEKTVTLPDGSTTQALVPQVYVKLQADDLHPSTGIMTGNTVTMQLSGDVVNQGTIAGRNFISLDAQNIHNLGGQLQADTTLLKASIDPSTSSGGNINNIGGQIIAKDAMVLQAENDINLRSTTQSSQNSSGASHFSRTNIDRVAGLYMDNPNAILVANAGNDVNLMAATIINRGEGAITQINAGQNINLSTITIAEQNNSIRNAKNYVKHGGTQDIGTQIQTNGNITLNAGNDFNATAANLTSETGSINVTATKDINITEGRETSNFDTARKVKKSSTFSSKTKTQRDVFASDNSISSNLSADNITLQAGNDLTVRGSNIVSDNGTTLNANNNLNINSAQNTAYELHERKTKTSGLSTSGASVSLGTSQLSTKQTTNSTSQTGSTVGSVKGDVNVTTGKVYTQTASDVLTPAGDININAQQVNITSAQNTSQSVQETKFKQTGLTLAITSPVISAIQTAQQMRQAASQTSDGRMQALAAGTTALSASNAYDATSAALNAKPTGSDVKDAANQAGGINVSLSIGTSKSSSKTTQTNSTAQSSTLNAGGDINITATGAGKDSDINVIGSTIKAANDVTFKADDQINLQAAQNTSKLDGKNKSSSASLGVSFGTSGLAVTASASQGKGRTTGNGASWTETIVQSGNQNGDKVTLESGTDTTLKGAQVIGSRVVANVGTSGAGNLNIQSLQDTDQYKDKQKSAGISVSIPIGAGSYGGSISASSSKTKSNYASVNEQSGIMAGDGGFQVNVNGNTDLKGAVIASTDKAAHSVDANGKPINSLTTQTLSTSNLENKADYSAKGGSISVGGNIGQNQSNQLLAGVTKSIGWGSASGSADSATISGISAGAIHITDSTAQAQTGKDINSTVATLNKDVKTQLTTDAQGNVTAIAVDSHGNNLADTIKPIFDKEQVQRELNAQMKITQSFDQAQQQFRMGLNKKVDDAKAQKDAIAEALKNQNLTEDQRMALITQGLNAQKEIEQLEKVGLVISAIGAGLSAPTNSIGGIIANSLAPEAANQIGQYFKDHGTEGSASHILAHGVLASAVAALGGNNPLGAAVSAMGGELAAPLVADLLYGKPSEVLNAEQKATVSAIATLGGIAAGTSINNSINSIAQANLSAQNAVDNNWGEVGHYSTMATVLYLAGFSPKDAKAIALAAWAPDTDGRNAMSAASLSLGNEYQEIIHLLDNEKDPAKVKEIQRQLTEKVGEIFSIMKDYENEPAEKARFLKNTDIQDLLHAFGDSFAHVKPDGTHYTNLEIGHAGDSTQNGGINDPDNPKTHSEAYKNYVNAIFGAAARTTESARVSTSTINNLIIKVTTAAESAQATALNNIIKNVIKATPTNDLVKSTVPDCGYIGCNFIAPNSLAGPAIDKIYGIKK